MNAAEITTPNMRGIPEDREIDWVNCIFIGSMHLGALGAIVYMITNFSLWTLLFAVGYGLMCGLAITGGYHRLFSHPTYKANALIRAVFLYFGAASVQNSALKWSADHRIHHSKTDTDADPYNISRGFWWAHIGWVLFREKEPKPEEDFSMVADLQKDAMVRFQHRYYIPLIFVTVGIVPALIGSLWGDALGGVLVAGVLRLVIQWHSTFSVNSFTHMFGSQPFCKKGSARDSWIVALITFGEGYHNFHHRFPIDYRNGVRWFQFDPTKWFVWTMSKVGATWDLRRTPDDRMQAAAQQVSGS